MCNGPDRGWKTYPGGPLCPKCEGYALIRPVGATPPEIDFYESFDPDKATEKDRALFEGLTGEVLYIDPYMGPATLERLSFFRNAALVRFLTWKVQDHDGTMETRLESFQAWIPKVKMRKLSGKELHSRYVIAGSRFIQLGHSAQGGGLKESAVSDTGDADYLKEQIDTFRQEFEDKWAKADPL